MHIFEKHYIGGFDITMNDRHLVCRVQRLEHL